VILALCINFIGDGLRDAFDPRQQGKVSRRKANRAVAAIPSVQGVMMVEGLTSSDDTERETDSFAGPPIVDGPADDPDSAKGGQP